MYVCFDLEGSIDWTSTVYNGIFLPAKLFDSSHNFMNTDKWEYFCYIVP